MLSPEWGTRLGSPSQGPDPLPVRVVDGGPGVLTLPLLG